MSEGVQILSVFGHFYFKQTTQNTHYQAVKFSGITLASTYTGFEPENKRRNTILTHRTNQLNQNDSIK